MKWRILLLFLLVGLLLSACRPSAADLEATTTRIAAEIIATMTASASPSVPPPTPPPIVPPTLTPIPMPIQTPVPAVTPVPAAPPTACTADAAFVTDVTVPDGTELAPGETFTKTWRMRSSGCEPWPADTVWAFVSGDQMAAPGSVSVAQPALTGTLDISVVMVAPDAPGTYRGFWQLQSPGGTRFGELVQVTIEVAALEAASPYFAVFSITNETAAIGQGDGILEFALQGPEEYFFQFGAVESRVEILPGGYTYGFGGCGSRQTSFGAPHRQMGTMTVSAGAVYEVRCSCQPIYAAPQEEEEEDLEEAVVIDWQLSCYGYRQGAETEDWSIHR